MTLVERIIQYAQQEVSEGKQAVENHACLSHEEWYLILGRVEFAEGLLANIKEWHDKEYNIQTDERIERQLAQDLG